MKSMMAVVLSTVLTLPTAARTADDFAACMDMFPGASVPIGKDAHDTDVCKVTNDIALFAVRFDRGRKIPDWAAHRLTPVQVNSLQKRTRPKFFPDPAVDKTDQAVHDSYSYTRYSRGHIVPAHDMSWNNAAYKMTFSLINVVPQKQYFNAGTWLGMEHKFRDLVANKQTPMWDISGVYGFNVDVPTLGQNPHTPTVPKCFFKIIVAQSENRETYKVMAGLFEYDDRRKQRAWVDGLTTLARIERRTGLDFLAGLSVEPTFDADYWDVSPPDIPGDCQ